jgi:predicted acetyltransferase
VTVDDWQRLDAVHQRYAHGANGALERDEMWWHNWVFGTWMGTTEGIVWQDNDGADQGYVLYFDPVTPDPSRTGINVMELTALTADAYLNLLIVLGQHDIRARIRFPAPLDDPLQLLFVDTERVQITERFTVMMRVVDLEAALRARPPADPSLNTELTLTVADASAPWNDGTWRLRAADGRLLAESAEGDGELHLDAKVLAPLYSGYITPSRAASAGLLRAESADTLRRADAIFAVTKPPYFPDSY